MKLILLLNAMNCWLSSKLKIGLVHYCPNISMEKIFTDTEKSKIYFFLNLTLGLSLRSSNKHAGLQNLSIIY